MYSVLMSKFNEGFPVVKDILKSMINYDSKVVIIPWSFATEIKSKNIDEFFNDKKKTSYLLPLCELGVKTDNIIILDCYKHSKEYIKDSINNSDVIVLTGGNPEMLYKKICEAGILELLRNYKKTIIGSSAGAELQLKKYFITKKNNYYNKFAWYDGLGIIDNDFYFDVHSTNKGRYLPSLKKRSEKINKPIYCVFDTGVIICNRKTNEISCYGKVIEFNCN